MISRLLFALNPKNVLTFCGFIPRTTRHFLAIFQGKEGNNFGFLGKELILKTEGSQLEYF